MTRIDRDFEARSAWEQQWLCENTWCQACRIADLGLVDPSEFEEDGRVYVQGYCRACGGVVLSEVVDQRQRS